MNDAQRLVRKNMLRVADLLKERDIPYIFGTTNKETTITIFPDDKERLEEITGDTTIGDLWWLAGPYEVPIKK